MKPIQTPKKHLLRTWKYRLYKARKKAEEIQLALKDDETTAKTLLKELLK